MAGHAREDFDLFGILDAFRRNAEIEHAAEREDRFHDSMGNPVVLDRVDEGPVDLQLVEWEFAQIGKAGIAGSEIVERDRCAARPELASAASTSIMIVPCRN
jgi:hypothetical protein